MNKIRALVGVFSAVSLISASGSLAWAGDSRFILDATGESVVDSFTGLVWRRCVEGQYIVNGRCSGVADGYSWYAALAHAKDVARRTGFAWRVPNVKELQSLVNRRNIGPALDMRAFPDAGCSWTWTSTPYTGNAFDSWSIDFFYGSVDTLNREYDAQVRLVRDSP